MTRVDFKHGQHGTHTSNSLRPAGQKLNSHQAMPRAHALVFFKQKQETLSHHLKNPQVLDHVEP